ncbi:MAG: hypothetical protein JSV66_14955 [Trueperaceae bacterium]|nr:MAG: hypothetical protein JSV66_14955 [Trueperaceae bacterium]
MMHHFNYRLYMRYAEERLMDLRGAGLSEGAMAQESERQAAPPDEEKETLRHSASYRAKVLPARNRARGQRRKRRVA